MTKYIDNTNLSYLISKIKAAFWPKADVTNVTLADVAITGSYDDLDDTPEVDSTPTANSTNLVTSGGVKAYVDGTVPSEEIFWATYGTTTSTQVQSALDAGKVPFTTTSDRVYCYAGQDTSYMYFCSVIYDRIYYVYLQKSNDSWTNGNLLVEHAANKVSTFIGNETASTKYPTTKATYDEIHPAVQSSQPVGGFLPNVTYDLGTITGTVTFALANPTNNNIANPYYWTFETSSTAPTITWPSGLTWQGESAPEIAASKHYEVLIRNGYANCIEFPLPSNS